MIHLALDDHEASLLAEMLAYDLTELGSEIRNTDARDYRDRLRHKEATLRSLLERLERSVAA